ncbi:hypothetical protein BDZ45DRAFT_679169 [Acephala macrosclerotiorum]|nr:hypothetical protein BDZ45DRAFT_679169 [Acephala macrosclerotiorum]
MIANPIGKFTAALVTAQNSNSLSLANLNFDFTLVKLEAPAEFEGLGMTISKQRKKDAEDGTLHKCARKLGALFEGDIPSTPKLFRAYGNRVSDISSQASVNPQGTQGRDGIFANHIGADAASIWAAVTSGAGAIAVHLLACMLARIFTGPEATAIWAELVEKQKVRLQNNSKGTLYAHEQEASIRAAQQDISRRELAEWDASARAWIQSADQAKELQHKQMMLILNNVSIPVNSEPETYESVMNAWKGALEAMENLVQGIPQRIQDGAALLGISAWHMYPDMVVLKEKPVDVKQKDPLFKDTALLTLGLEAVGRKSVSWSLPLSRLQYYGEPVRTERSAGQDNTRITAKEFSYVILGGLFGGWKDFAPTPEVGLQWLEPLANLTKDPSYASSLETSKLSDLRFWLSYLHRAAQSLVNSSGVEGKIARQLYRFGTRRSRFLYAPHSTPPPLFGISHLSNLIPILVDDDAQVNFLRKVIPQLGLSPNDCIIRFRPLGHKVTFDYTTIEPTTSTSYTIWLTMTEEEIAQYCVHGVLHPVIKEKIKDTSKHYLPALKITGFRGKNERLAFGTGASFRNAAESLRAFNRGGTGVVGTVELVFIAGDPNSAAIFSTSTLSKQYSYNCISEKDMKWVMGHDQIDRTRFLEYLSESEASSHGYTRFGSTRKQEFMKSIAVTWEVQVLKACAAIGELYTSLPGASISTLVFETPLSAAKWIPGFQEESRDFRRSEALFSNPTSDAQTEHGCGLTLQQSFACICMLDSGTCNLDPDALDNIFALSTGNSIFVAGALLCDPFEAPKAEVRRVTGNIGRAGISLLLPPPEPKILKRSSANWSVIDHGTFDGTPEDGFQKTSIHLSFTEYEFALKVGNRDRHIIDRPINLLETLVSVYDGSRWVADLDILEALDAMRYRIGGSRAKCIPPHRISDELKLACEKRPRTKFQEARHLYPLSTIITIDNWDELLDPPGYEESQVMVVRAHKNWLARLALATVCWKKGLKTIVASDTTCWPCMSLLLADRVDKDDLQPALDKLTLEMSASGFQDYYREQNDPDIENTSDMEVNMSEDGGDLLTYHIPTNKWDQTQGGIQKLQTSPHGEILDKVQGDNDQEAKEICLESVETQAVIIY